MSCILSFSQQTLAGWWRQGIWITWATGKLTTWYATLVWKVKQSVALAESQGILTEKEMKMATCSKTQRAINAKTSFPKVANGYVQVYLTETKKLYVLKSDVKSEVRTQIKMLSC